MKFHILTRIVFMTVLVLIFSVLAAVILINYLQIKHIESLPMYLRSWDYLPLYLRSLQPYDDFIVKYLYFSKLCKKISETSNQNNNSLIKSNDVSENKNDSKVVVFNNNAFEAESF